MIQNPKLLGIQRTGKCNPKRNPLQVTLVVKNPPANAGALRDLDSVPGWGRSLGEENGSPLHYSCLENPVDRGAWWATVHGTTNSWTQPRD